MIRRVLSDWIRQLKEREFEALLAEGYRESAKQAAEFAASIGSTQAAALEATWRWDD